MKDEGMKDQAGTHLAPYEYSPRIKVVAANPKSPSVLGLAGFMAMALGTALFLSSVSTSMSKLCLATVRVGTCIKSDLAFLLCPSYRVGRYVIYCSVYRCLYSISL